MRNSFLKLPGRGAAGRLIVAALLAAASAAYASSSAAQFRPALQIMVEKPGSERGDCGLADTPIHAVAKLALESNGVRESADAAFMLYIHPVVIPEGRMCFVNLDVSVRGRQNAGALGGFKPKEGWRGLLLCSAGTAGVADIDVIRQDFLNQLAQQIKVCLNTLDY